MRGRTAVRRTRAEGREWHGCGAATASVGARGPSRVQQGAISVQPAASVSIFRSPNVADSKIRYDRLSRIFADSRSGHGKGTPPAYGGVRPGPLQLALDHRR
jgi:hypothetical protein